MIFDVNKTFCFTGHRPHKLYGYDKTSDGNVKLRTALRDAIIYAHIINGIDNFISGMAQGWDLWAAEIVLDLQKDYPNLKLICAIPCKGHKESFPKEIQDYYNTIIEMADLVRNITGIKYFPRCMQIRDEWMVNNSCGQIVGWDGSRGGTYNTLMYANKVNKINRIWINPKTFQVKMYGL